MSNIFLYPRLAAAGVRKNSRSYLPYILTCAGMIMMYYIVAFLERNKFIGKMNGGQILQLMLELGSGVMIAFAAVFLFYTNSFLIRGRKKEFGLYNILGMGKVNIARILIWDTLIVYLLSEVLGLGCGILFSKLAELVASNILGGNVEYEFTVSADAIRDSLIFFAVISLLITANALRQIHLASPIDLLKSENTGERPPKSNIFLALLGFAVLAAAYFMAVTIKNPLQAIFVFFLAVLMVIGATYMLFIAGSVVICRMLQKNKNYYYKTNHFVSVSSMVYRMKRNGAGLASICILSTMVLVTVSSTVCLYAGEEGMLNERYPRDMLITSYSSQKDDIDIIDGFTKAALEKFGAAAENNVEYTYISISGAFEGDGVILDPTNVNMLAADARTITFVTVQELDRIAGGSTVLQKDEVIAASRTGKDAYNFDSIAIKELGTFKIVGRTEDFEFRGSSAAAMEPELYLFVADADVLNDIYKRQFEVYEERYASGLHRYRAFDLNCDEETQMKIFDEIHFLLAQYQKDRAEIDGGEYLGYRLESKVNDRGEFFALYGGLFFLGIIFGIVFTFAAALIMYYKQISEGYEDKARFEILQKVGMTKREIRRSISSQVLTVFFLPLLAAGIHMIFAFPMVSRLLLIFGLNNTGLFMAVTLCCFGAFAAVYIAVYAVTSRSYYTIVSK